MAITPGTNITGIQIPEIGVDSAPTWAQALNDSLGSSGIDGHDHTTNKGSRITPAAINVNADFPLNSNDLTEVRTVSLDATSGTGTGDVRAVYANSAGNLFYRNNSGAAVQITDGSSIVGTSGSISGMDDASPNAQASFAHGTNTYSFYHNSDSTAAKMAHADIFLYKYSASDGSASADYVTIQVQSDASGSSGTITVPTETGTLVSSASVLSDISVTNTTTLKPILSLENNTNDATSSEIRLKNLRGGSNAGVANDDCGLLTFWGNDAANNNQIFGQLLVEVSDPASGGEEGKMSLMVAEYDGTVTAGLVITGQGSAGIINVSIGAGVTSVTSISGTLDLGERDIDNVGDIALDSITADGSVITISSTWTAASQTCNDLGSVTTCDINGGAIDAITLGTNSAVTEADIDNININGNTILTTDSNGDLNLDCNGTGDIECAADVKTSTTKKVYSKGNAVQTNLHSSLVFGY